MSEQEYLWVLTDGEVFADCKIRTEAEAEELHKAAKASTDGCWWWIKHSLPKTEAETIAEAKTLFEDVLSKDDDTKKLREETLGGIALGFYLGRGIPLDQAKRIIFSAIQ